MTSYNALLLNVFKQDPYPNSDQESEHMVIATYQLLEDSQLFNTKSFTAKVSLTIHYQQMSYFEFAGVFEVGVCMVVQFQNQVKKEHVNKSSMGSELNQNSLIFGIIIASRHRFQSILKL